MKPRPYRHFQDARRGACDHEGLFQAGSPHSVLGVRTLPSVCRAPQPHAQGTGGCRRPERRAEPARTLSKPKGRRHGRGAACSRCRSGGAGMAARRPVAAAPRARGTQRSRGSIAGRTRAEGRTTRPRHPVTSRAAGSPALAREALSKPEDCRHRAGPRPLLEAASAAGEALTHHVSLAAHSAQFTCFSQSTPSFVASQYAQASPQRSSETAQLWKAQADLHAAVVDWASWSHDIRPRIPRTG